MNQPDPRPDPRPDPTICSVCKEPLDPTGNAFGPLGTIHEKCMAFCGRGPAGPLVEIAEAFLEALGLKPKP